MRRPLLLALAFLTAAGCGGGRPDGGRADGDPRRGTLPAADGLPIAYTARGTGPLALVFIHGWMCDQSDWKNQVDAFSDRYTVVTLDLAGHGASRGKERPGWPLASFGRDVQAVVEGLDLGRVVLVGHSMGAPVALEAARRMPRRVIGIVGVDSLQNVEAKMSPEQVRQILDRFEADFDGTCNSFVRDVLFHPDADPQLVDEVAGKMCSSPADVALAIWRQFPDYDTATAIAAVEVPVRCINGTVGPTDVAVNRRHAKDFDAVILDGSGHFPMLERPAEFNRALEEAVAAIVAEAP